ncbi:MAG: aminodeoxychorismate/anthranilate synthase component II [Phycisphaerae bacterium]
MVLLIDNYDSFTFNLYQCIGSLAPSNDIVVRRSDEITPTDIDALQPTHLIVSPGPCTPAECPQSVAAIRHLAGRVPILGVCLGHQCIAAAFGGTIIRADRLMHGKTSRILHDGKSIYTGLSNPFTATRYHSLTVDADAMPPDFERTAWTQDQGELMGIRHQSMPIEGVQFHPESFLTDQGPQIIANFLAIRN